MAIEETRRVVNVQVNRSSFGNEVNDYLAAGWVLLGVFTQSTNDCEGWAGAVFCLGWQRPEPAVHPEGSFYREHLKRPAG